MNSTALTISLITAFIYVITAFTSNHPAVERIADWCKWASLIALAAWFMGR